LFSALTVSALIGPVAKRVLAAGLSFRRACNSRVAAIVSHVPMPAKFFCRKDLARMLELSVQQVAWQERNLGLSGCRENVNKRVVRYPAAAALAALKARNLLPLDG
jgi:hypothetical protein